MIITCVCLFAGIFFAKNFAALVHYFATVTQNTNVAFFDIGFILFCVAWYFIKDRIQFLRTLVHEMNHALFQMLSGHKPKELFVSDTEGGYVAGTGSNIFIILAPYFFPFLVIASLLPFALIDPARYKPYYLVVGALTAFHLLVSVSDYITQFKASRMSDINRLGRGFSTVVIAFGNIVIYGAIMAFIAGGPSAAGWFIVGTAQEIINIY